MRPIKVLIIEDEWLIRAELQNMLQQFAFIQSVAEAGTIADALRQAREFRPDLVFLDIHLPDGSGFAFLDKCRNPFEVIFITAYDQYQAQAKKYHPMAYLMKPINKEKLRRIMQGIKEQHYEKNEC